ncbi:hypothetical protein L7F22_005366 [Adiantum nelumboides]|nr:hypothetical protein [Adiantum nelumboides]
MMHGKLCVTKQLRPEILIECHDPPYVGHRRIDATLKAADTFFYWPTLRRDVDAFVRSCLVHYKVKFDKQKAPRLLQPFLIPDKPWDLKQMNSHLEEANSTILNLLKCYVSEHKATWEHYLPLVKYAYNKHTSTGKGPFEIVEGGKKNSPISQTKEKIFETDKYVQNTDEAYRKRKLALEKTLSKQKKAIDCHRRELVLSLGDWVLLRFEKARLRKMKGKKHLFPKLGMRYYGPFQVCDKIDDVAYRLKLLQDWKTHNAFHVSLLRPFVGDVLENMVSKE